MYEELEKAMNEELEAIEQKLEEGSGMSIQDLEKVDKLAHALKSLVTYKAMKESEDRGHKWSKDSNGHGCIEVRY